MNYLTEFLNAEWFSAICTFFGRFPEAVLLVGFILFLLVREKFHAALMLVFGATLCFANYYLFSQYSISLISLPYAMAFAGISIFVLLLIVYQLVQTA
jgi:hypothetical protein